MRVLLSGYYGAGNLGDEALLAGIAAALRRRGLEPVVLSADPAATRRLHGVEAAHRLRGALPALLRADALVSGGGGLLQDTTSGRSLRYYLGLVRAARLLRRPVAVFAQSVGPLSPGGRRRVGAALRGIPVAVRDHASRELLAGLGIDAKLVGDGALLLEPPSVDPAPDAPTLLVPRAGHPELTDALAAAGRAVRQGGGRVAVLAIQPGEDERELERLRAGVEGLEPWSAADHREALRRIAASGMVLSARLHGLVLAAVAGRPLAGLVYDPKVRGFCERLGAPVFSPPVDVAALSRVALARPAPDPARLAALRASAEDGVDWLERVLRGRSAGAGPA